MNKKIKDQLNSIHQMVNARDFVKAHKLIDKLLKKNTTSHELLNFKAYIYMSEGLWNESLIILQKSNLFHPENINTIFNLGIVYEKINNYEDAITSYKKCIIKNNNYLDPYIQIIRISIQNYDITSSLEYINQILKINDNLEIVYHLQAQSFRLINDYSNQLVALEKARDINPSNDMNYVYIAFIMLWNNKVDQAKEILHKAISIKKNFFAIYHLMQIDKNCKFFNNSKYLEESFTPQGDENDIYFYLSLAEYYKSSDDLYIQNLIKANKIKRSIISYNKKYFDDLRNDIFNYFDPSVNFLDVSCLEINPIFIIGMPRSGSSLVEQVLINNPRIKTCGEVELLNNYFGTKKLYKNLNSNNLKIILNRYLTHIKLITNSSHFIDKLPLNFIWIGFIKKIFPNSKFIVTNRKKFDNCFSIYQTFFGDNSLPFSYEPNEIAHFYDTYNYFINHWGEIFKDSIYIAEYDKLTTAPELEFKKLFNFLDMKFESSYLDTENSSSIVQTASFNQVKKPIKKHSGYKKYHKFFPCFLD